MLKKLITLSFLYLILSSSGTAQNIQFHYDFRSSLYGDNLYPSNYLTTTFEMFKPDKWGSTFMFVDFDFNQKHRNLGLTYAEIARNFKIGDFPILPHIEYNGGIILLGDEFGININNSYLLGIAYPFPLGNFFISTYIAYKANSFHKLSHDIQWTGVWTSSFLKGKLSFTGFIDLWTENKDRIAGLGGKKLVMLSEPQIWYNINNNISLGSEIEISSNFYPQHPSLIIIPTLAVKWNFID